MPTGQTEWRPYLDEPLAWIREHHPDALPRIFPGGKLVPDARNRPRVGRAPPGVARRDRAGGSDAVIVGGERSRCANGTPASAPAEQAASSPPGSRENGERRRSLLSRRDGGNGTNGRYDISSVGIEFANELALSGETDRFYAFGVQTPNTVYKGPYLPRKWRGFEFAQLDEAQVDAGIALTLDICRRHDITPVFYYPSTSFAYPRCIEVATRCRPRASWAYGSQHCIISHVWPRSLRRVKLTVAARTRRSKKR